MPPAILPFAILFLIVSFSIPTNAQWFNVDDGERLILFQPPGLGDGLRETSVKTTRDGSRAEWLCWNGLQDRQANACITFQKAAKRFRNRIYWAKDITRLYRSFKRVDAVFEGDQYVVDHPLGPVNVVRFNVLDHNSTQKKCAAFLVDFSTKRKLIDAWYCAPPGEPLSDMTLEKIISTVGLKGQYEPARVEY